MSVLGVGYPENLKEKGIPSEREFIERYAKMTSIKLPNNWYYYVSFSFFRLASIAFGVYARSLQGNASSTKAHLTKEISKNLSTTAYEIIKKATSGQQIEQKQQHVVPTGLSNQEESPQKYNHQIRSILDDNSSSFRLSPKAKELFKKFVLFMDEFVYPNERFFVAYKEENLRWSGYPPIIDKLKEEAKSRGLWNLFLPDVGGIFV